jgi:hypothetical protein
MRTCRTGLVHFRGDNAGETRPLLLCSQGLLLVSFSFAVAMSDPAHTLLSRLLAFVLGLGRERSFSFFFLLVVQNSKGGRPLT